MKNGLLKILPLLLCLPFSNILYAAAEKEVGWDDLIAPEESISDPYTGLNDEQMFVFIEVLLVLDQISAGETVPEADLAQHQDYINELKGQGVEVERLVAEVNAMSEKRGNKTIEANPQLDGANIRMPGYMLPLEFNGKVVTEFLLVPYVGACIHTPPPPANQIVHVKSKKGYKPKSRFFSPVWINGMMQIEGKKIDTTLIDGSTLIYTAYTMDDAEVEAFF